MSKTEMIKTDINESMENRYLVFLVGGEAYAISITYITEIVEITPITSVPSIPYYMRGIINLRGTIIPVMDGRLRFGYEEGEYTSRTCIIVIEKDEMTVGLIVDAVQEVSMIPPSQISRPPSMHDVRDSFVKGIGKDKGEVQLIADCEKLLECAV